MRKTILGMVLLLAVCSILGSSCVEGHYYHHYHHHTRGWYDHRHQPYPPGVDFNVDVR